MSASPAIGGAKFGLAAALATVALAIPATTASAGDGTFAAGIPDAAGWGPISIAVGDLDSDGDADLAVANQNSDSVTIHLGRANGTFAAAVPYATGDRPQSVAVGDFDSDGSEDLAIANLGGPLAGDLGNVTVHLGNGDGTFDPSVPYATGDRPHSVAVGDFNHDADEDLAVANDVSDDVTVHLGVGDGTFAAADSYATGGGGDSVAVGDFDSDGDEDLAVASGDVGGVTINLGAGDGTFAPAFPYAAGGSPRSVAVGDFNADGNEDLAAVANTGAGTGIVTVHLGAGDGSFFAAVPYAAGDSPRSVAIGDFDSDGDEDLAVANLGSGNVAVHLGAGDGTFAAAIPYTAGTNPGSVAVGDFFAPDGNEDLAVANFGDPGSGDFGNVTVHLGNGPATLAGNLLVNGGAEGPGAGQTFGATPAIPGWTRTGNMTYARYSLAGNWPQHLDSARWGGGVNFFTGGPSGGPARTASQTVSVAGSADSIDAGLASVRLAAELGGYRTEIDRAKVSATFLDAGGAPLGSFEIGPVTAADRNFLTTLISRAQTQPVPVGTRQVAVVIEALGTIGFYHDGYADNVKLTLSVAQPPDPGPGPVPDPQPQPDPPDTSPPETLKGKGPKRTIESTRAKFAFTSSEAGSTFECSLDRRAFKPCSSPKRVRNLKPGRHRFRAVAIDAAGNRDASPARWRFRVIPG